MDREIFFYEARVVLNWSRQTTVYHMGRFVQFGKFRVGEADGNHFVVTHISGQLIQLYRNLEEEP